MSQVRLPRLLDSDLNEIARLHPSQLTVTLNLTPLSTASMVLPDGEPIVDLKQYVEIYGADGSLGIFRVASTGTEYGDEQEVMLEHGIVTLEDDITDAETELTGTMKSIMTSIINKQTEKKWKIGTVEAEGNDYKLEVDRDNLLSALLDAVKLVDGYALELDQSTSTWKIHLRKLPTEPGCECRMHRNIENIKITIDRQNLCTRAYSELLPGGYMDANTISNWGVVAREVNIPAGASEDDAKRYTKAYLKESKNPNVAIEIDAVELSRRTGEPLDALKLGELCRTALPEWNMVKDERLISLRYTDLMNNPDQVRVTLSKPARDLAHLVASTNRSVGGGGGSGGAKNVWKHIFDTEQSVLVLHDKSIELQAVTTTLNGKVSSAEIRLDAAEANINLKVNQDGIISAINMSPEGITISASKINLSGYVTASRFNAEIAEIESLLSGSAVITYAKFSAITIGNTYINNTIQFHSITINGTRYNLLGGAIG